MLSIGEFAGATGLSVKALRHYDDKGVLVPAFVHPVSGYRRYAENQLRSGVVVRTLRDAGVPLPDVAAAVATGEPVNVADAYRSRVVEERAIQDAAFERARRILSALAMPADIIERTCAQQSFLGRVMSSADGELSDENADNQFAELFADIQNAGLGPSGAFWTAIRLSDDGDSQIVGCWPTTTYPDTTRWANTRDTVIGQLPARTELVALWQPGDGVELVQDTLHPAVVALFDALSDREVALEATELRQRVLYNGESIPQVEVAVTIAKSEQEPTPGR